MISRSPFVFMSHPTPSTFAHPADVRWRGWGVPQERLAGELVEDICTPLKQRKKYGMWSAETVLGCLSSVLPRPGEDGAPHRFQVGTKRGHRRLGLMEQLLCQ